MVKKDYNGLLVQVCNPSAMAEAIEKLITDTELRKEFGRHSVERQHSMFSLTAYINNFDRLYTKQWVKYNECFNNYFFLSRK